jgi:hypothetical protein
MGEVNVQLRGVSRGVLFVFPAHECTETKRSQHLLYFILYKLFLYRCTYPDAALLRRFQLSGYPSNLCLYPAYGPPLVLSYRVRYGILEFPWSYEA